mmetsp:Transcript_3349/g.3317  ORF Transcript_3349/g.3317 Transcript_3349/m.3317 type:complete len:219 (-) Transcript_3349:8-664(-)
MKIMLKLIISILSLFLFNFSFGLNDNINGIYTVKTNFHYPNKSTVVWGENNQKYFSVKVSLSSSCGTYNSSTSCDDPAWYNDWNKLWGKARCGYANSHHDDSDRFVWRRASVSNDNTLISLGAYSYDNGKKPFETPGLLKSFTTLLYPNTIYTLTLDMNETGLSTYTLLTENGEFLEQQTIQHENLCVDNFYEGTVHGLYFGGDCRAPTDVTIQYWSE